jgi:nuclear pore complex protein Nup107
MGSLMQLSKGISDASNLKLERSAELLDQLTYEAESQLARLGADEDDDYPQWVSKHRAAVWLIEELKSVTLAIADRMREAQKPSSLSKSWRSRVQSVKEQKKFDSSISNLNISDDSEKDLQRTLAEANTYELLQKVLVIRKPEPTHVALDSSIQLYLEVRGSTHEFTPEAELWERFLLSDQTAREKKAILSWLELVTQDSEADIDSIVQELESSGQTGQGTWSHGFLHTRERIKAEKRKKWVDTPLSSQTLRTSEDTEPLVTQLDPDAPARQDKSLEKPDDYYDRSLWLACFAMLRRGMSWEDIREWCESHREGWRAVSFGMAVDKQESRTGLAGPQAGILWRQMCLAAARHSGFDTYQRAVYGLLAGDIKSVDPACRSFDDLIYVRYNAMLIRAFEEYLQKSASGRFTAALGQKFPALNSTLTEEELGMRPADYVYNVISNPLCAQDATNPFKVIQASIIGDDFQRLIINVGLILADRANQGGRRSHLLPRFDDYAYEERYACIAEDFDAIRLVVHIFAIYDYAGYEFPPEIKSTCISNVIVAYIDYLRLQRKIDAIPTYTALLDIDRRHATLGVILADITDRHEQELLVNLVLKQEVNLTRLVTEQYMYAADLMGIQTDSSADISRYDMLEPTMNTRWPGYRIKSGFEIDATLDEKQERLVRSVEWFKYEDLESQWKEIFHGLSYAMRTFLLAGMVNGALALTKRVPFRAVSVIKSKMYLGRGVDVFNLEHDGTDEENQNRRSTRSNANTQRNEDEVHLDGEGKEFMLDLLRKSSRQYREMQQMVLVIECLALWGSLEEQISHREP